MQLEAGVCERSRLGARTFADVVDARIHDTAVKRLEAELCAPGGQGLDDAANVVADEDEAGDLAVGLHGSPQRVLGILQAMQTSEHIQCVDDTYQPAAKYFEDPAAKAKQTNQ